MRLDSYESEEHQEWVRRFLNGTFQNSVFCLLSPDGEKWLTKSGRGPQQVFGGRVENLITGLEEHSAKYKAKAATEGAVVQDFHSLRQALNVASADQRVLVVVAGSEEESKPLRESLRKVAWDKANVGRFHWDFESDEKVLKELLKGQWFNGGILIVKSSEFGLDGQIMVQLPHDISAEKLNAALAGANKDYAANTEKKVYSEHVAEGRKQGIHFEGAVPYGEDRDGDGEIDKKRGR